MMKWEILSSDYLLKSKWLTVRKDYVRMPSGIEMDDYYVLEYPDWINVIAITEDGENLLLFNPGDVDKLAGCLETLIDSAVMRETLSKASLHLAQTTFNIETINNQIGALYESF